MHLNPPHTPVSMPTTIVGSGRVGGSLAEALRAAGAEVTLVGRSTLEDVAPRAHVILLCVPDGEISAACERVVAASPNLEAIGHTSGASGLDALRSAADRDLSTFSLHPLQTIPSPGADLTGAPAAIAGSDEAALAIARELAVACGMTPFAVPEESRAAYHAAAAMASNFLIALEESAAGLLEAAGVEDGRELLTPLVLRTVANWAEHGGEALTGPIARGDEETVRRHLEAIDAVAPELADTYRALAGRTRAIASEGARR